MNNPTFNKKDICTAIDSLVKVKAAMHNPSALDLTPLEINHLHALYDVANEFVHFFPKEELNSIMSNNT